jgi:4-alpha-glucanotransferase
MKSFGCDIPLIVEDIGSVTKEVFQLRDHFQFYGITILQMGFYSYPDNIYSPHNYIPNSIAYTGFILIKQYLYPKDVDRYT